MNNVINIIVLAAALGNPEAPRVQIQAPKIFQISSKQQERFNKKQGQSRNSSSLVRSSGQLKQPSGK